MNLYLCVQYNPPNLLHFTVKGCHNKLPAGLMKKKSYICYCNNNDCRPTHSRLAVSTSFLAAASALLAAGAPVATAPDYSDNNNNNNNNNNGNIVLVFSIRHVVRS